MTESIYILGGARTPMAEYVGALKDFTAVALGVVAAKEALRRSRIAPSEVEHVVMGNAQQTSADSIYGARHVGLKAGIPHEVPALTVNRLCGSGIQSVVSAAHLMRAGEARLTLAGGMESMSQAPFVVRGAREGLRLGAGRLEDSLMAALLDSQCNLYMANTAELLAERYGITREASDEYALRSQRAAEAAYRAGKLQEEIVPVEVPARNGSMLFSEDDHRRPETTLEALSKLRPAFGRDGMVTGGNASGIVDGGAALVLATESLVKERKLIPMGRVVSWAYAGVPPEIMGIGPAPATREALGKAGLALSDMDRIEVNEAFAPQYLAVEKELGLDRDKTNVNGGAIALGHPLGATGTRLVLTLLHELRREKLRYGLATACIGGGQGIAMIVERAG
ncbi:MAG TPA: acetyl-CoA C-acetyltransferase [Vicinamibacteria bacterium]|nr:acetyl-CoA C-acetyltransferase [Vicinamibacteria bacterium]